MNDPAIAIRDLVRSYGDVRAVDGLDLEVHSGEVVGLLGPNGAGKTTTLRVVATLIKPDSGTVCVNGVDVIEHPQRVRANMGYQTGDTGLYMRLNPVEFLQYFGRLHGVKKNQLDARVASLVEEFGISEFADRLCGNLSTGQQQRVGLARTLIADPPVLVLDEPTSGLDIVSSQFILRALTGFAQQGRAVLFSTHVMSEVEMVCDRVVLMHRGHRLRTGSVEEILSSTEQDSFANAFLELIDSADALRGAS